MKNEKKTLVFDFDGVIHRYSKGWQDGTIYDIPVKGIKETIEKLREDYKIIIVSTRCTTIKGQEDIKAWLKKYDIIVDDIMDTKPPAYIYVDDRAVPFNGNCDTLMKNINNFKCWNETSRKKCPMCGKEFFDDNMQNGARNRRKYCSMDCRVKANLIKNIEHVYQIDNKENNYE